jgi:cytochrome b6-f complex subunit 4
MTSESEEDKTITEESVPFYPDHVRTELWVAGGIGFLLLLVGITGLRYPLGLGEIADPMNTPAGVKPEWYFLALYQLLKFIPKGVGAVLPVATVVLLVLWPFIDRRPDQGFWVQRLRIAITTTILLLTLILTLWGEVGS